MIRINAEKCDNCLECIAVCPDDVIVFKAGKVEVIGDCCMCVACIAICPKEALSELSE